MPQRCLAGERDWTIGEKSTIGGRACLREPNQIQSVHKDEASRVFIHHLIIDIQKREGKLPPSLPIDRYRQQRSAQLGGIPQDSQIIFRRVTYVRVVS